MVAARKSSTQASSLSAVNSYEPGTPADAMDAVAIKDASPISFASEDGPPIMQVHGDIDIVVPLLHASTLNQRMKSIGVESVLIVIPGGNHGVEGAGPDVVHQPAMFCAKISAGALATNPKPIGPFLVL